MLLFDNMLTTYKPTKKFFSPDDLAEMLDISKRSVYRLITERKIRFHKIRGRIRIDRNDVDTYLQECAFEVVG